MLAAIPKIKAVLMTGVITLILGTSIGWKLASNKADAALNKAILAAVAAHKEQLTELQSIAEKQDITKRRLEKQLADVQEDYEELLQHEQAPSTECVVNDSYIDSVERLLNNQTD